MLQIGNPGAKCNRDIWDHYGLHGECWSSLVSVKTPLKLNAYDITGITSNCLIILLSLLSVIAAYKKKKIIIYVVGCLIILATLVLILYTCLIISLFAESRDAPNSFDSSGEVYDQLMDSLHAYRDGDPTVMNAWENMMKEGCCCGVVGYRDFLKTGTDIPEYCTCNVEKTSDRMIYYPGTRVCYTITSRECHVEPKFNVTSIGCREYVLDQVQENQNHVLIIKIITLMSVSTSQLILVFLAMMFTSCCLHVPKQSDCGRSVNRGKFVPLPEPEDSKDDASIDAV